MEQGLLAEIRQLTRMYLHTWLFWLVGTKTTAQARVTGASTSTIPTVHNFFQEDYFDSDTPSEAEADAE